MIACPELQVKRRELFMIQRDPYSGLEKYRLTREKMEGAMQHTSRKMTIAWLILFVLIVVALTLFIIFH
jgi:hypothetical protein